MLCSHIPQAECDICRIARARHAERLAQIQVALMRAQAEGLSSRYGFQQWPPLQPACPLPPPGPMQPAPSVADETRAELREELREIKALLKELLNRLPVPTPGQPGK